MTEQEFNTIYWEYCPGLLRYALQILKIKQEAEDVCADVFVKFVEKAREGYSFKNIRAFLFTCLRNRCLTRKQNIKVVRRNETVFFDQQDTEENLFYEDARTEYVKILIDKASGLSPRRKDVLLLTAAGYRTQEIAKVMDMEHGSAKSQKARAVKKMKELINT